MLLIDCLAKLATEEKIKLDEEERKKAAADKLHQDSLVPETEQRPDYIRYICKRKRTPREVCCVIRNTPEGSFEEYPKEKLNDGTDFDDGQPPHRDENWRREILLKKPVVYDGEVKVNKQVVEKTMEYERTSNGVSKRKRFVVKTLENRAEESDDDEFYEGQKAIKKRKEEGSRNGILIRERSLKEGFNEGLNNRNEKIEEVVCNETEVSIRAGSWKQPVESSGEEADGDELYQGEKGIKIQEKREDGDGFFTGKINKKQKESFDKKSVKSRSPVYDEGPFPEPGLPDEVKEQICERAREKGGVFDEKDKAILVIQKALTASDINKHQNRFSIPEKKMNKSFLSAEEEAFLDSKLDGKRYYNRIIVDMIEPSGTVKLVPFSRWKMPKQGGKTSVSYVIKGAWTDIVPSNGLEAGKVVQLWAVRINGGLCFAFVILD